MVPKGHYAHAFYNFLIMTVVVKNSDKRDHDSLLKKSLVFHHVKIQPLSSRVCTK